MSEKKLPLLIGESPSAAGDRYHAFPLSGNPAKFICSIAQIDVGPKPSIGDYFWAMTEHFDTANSLERYPRKGWDAELAAKTVADLVVGYTVVVLMGRRAQQAYATSVDPRLVGAPFYEWIDPSPRWTALTDRRAVVSIPHSSWLNQLYNDPSHLDRTRSVLKEAMSRARSNA